MTELEIVKKKYECPLSWQILPFTYFCSISHSKLITIHIFIFHFSFLVFFSLLLKEEIAENAQLQLAEVSSERQRLRDTSEALETQLKNVLHARYVPPGDFHLIELGDSL